MFCWFSCIGTSHLATPYAGFYSAVLVGVSFSCGLPLRFFVFWSGRLIKIAGGHLTIPFQIGSDCRCAEFSILFSIYSVLLSRQWFVSKRGKLRKLHCRRGGY